MKDLREGHMRLIRVHGTPTPVNPVRLEVYNEKHDQLMEVQLTDEEFGQLVGLWPAEVNCRFKKFTKMKR